MYIDSFWPKGFRDKFEPLFEEEEEILHDFTILVFPEVKTKDLLVSSNEFYRNKPSLVGNIDKLKSEINRIALQHNMVDTDPLVLMSIDNIASNKARCEIFFHTVSFKTGVQTHKILYYNEVGYQRKGMRPEFYEDFENCKDHFERDAVIKAFAYIDPGRPDWVRSNFQKNFIDNFIEGESIFCVSW
ncbi:MAG: hypothetical protein ACHP6H_07500 [Legionellales bacterium]